MRYLTLRLAAALLTFGLGVAAYAAWVADHRPLTVGEAVPASRLREEEWHRLYEAAGMTGDSEIQRNVFERLTCANADGVADARYVEVDGRTWCQREDGSVHEINVLRGPYGQMSGKVRDEHSRWTLRNAAFVRTISTAQKAKEYVYSRL